MIHPYIVHNIEFPFQLIAPRDSFSTLTAALLVVAGVCMGVVGMWAYVRSGRPTTYTGIPSAEPLPRYQSSL